METRPIDTTSIIGLFERLGDGIYTLAVRVVGDRHLGEDVVQETFLIAMRKFHTWRGDGSIDGWLYRIGYRQALAVLRKRRDHPVDPVDLADRAGSVQSPEGDVMRAELAGRIDRAIGTLTPTLRATFVLRDIEGLPTAEVAAALDLTESAVKMRLKRARMALRDELRGYL